MDNEVPTLPSLNDMTSKEYTLRDWLRFYQNVWNRQLVARLSDVQFDAMNNPDEPTEEEVLDAKTKQPRLKLTKERLQERKAKVQAALALLAAFVVLAKDMESMDEAAFTAKYLSPEALKIDESVFQSEDTAGPKTGEACKTLEGKDGTWQDNGDGNLLCIDNEMIKTMPKKYKVVSPNGVSLNGVEAVQAAGTIVELDSNGEQTVALLASGAIVEDTTEPSAEAKV